MSTAAAREGRDHDTLLPRAAAVVIVMLAALAAQFAPQKVAAQSAPCTAIADDAERLACYDRALRAAPPSAPAPPVAPPPTTPPAATAPAAEATIVPPAQTPVSPVEAPPASSAQAPAAEDQQQDVDRQIVQIVVVGVRTLQGRETTFTTQDGASWVQTDSQRVVGLPATPFEAELKPGVVGSTFLVPKNGARAIRVRPVQR